MEFFVWPLLKQQKSPNNRSLIVVSKRLTIFMSQWKTNLILILIVVATKWLRRIPVTNVNFVRHCWRQSGAKNERCTQRQTNETNEMFNFLRAKEQPWDRRWTTLSGCAKRSGSGMRRLNFYCFASFTRVASMIRNHFTVDFKRA